MIVTVTLNPAVDMTMSIPRFALGRINRAAVERVDPGGKGINVAKAVSRLGSPVLALGFVAGNYGRSISESLAREEILTDFIYVDGETRVNLKIKDPISGVETEINQPGFEVVPSDLRKLQENIEKHSSCSVMVFSGSLPPGVPTDTYATFIEIAKRGGAGTILDTSGAGLRNGMAARPYLVKPNRAEVEEQLKVRIRGEQELANAARKLLASGPRSVVVSSGAEGAVAATAEGAWWARPPAIRTATTVGAGDAMVGAFAHAMVQRLPFLEALRLSTAAATAAASVTGSRVADLETIRALLPQVIVEQVSETKIVRTV
jgi:1-phosphofructokinase